MVCGVDTRTHSMYICGNVHLHSNAVELGPVVSADIRSCQCPAVRFPINPLLLQTCTSSFFVAACMDTAVLERACMPSCVWSTTMALIMLDLLSDKSIATVRYATMLI